jgi:hypothetical protein
MTQIVTASATRDGQPLYRQADGSWTPELAQASVLENESDASAQLEAARREEARVCDPYLIDVSRDEGRVVPVSFRERIRATGPTVPLHRSA